MIDIFPLNCLDFAGISKESTAEAASTVVSDSFPLLSYRPATAEFASPETQPPLNIAFDRRRQLDSRTRKEKLAVRNEQQTIRLVIGNYGSLRGPLGFISAHCASSSEFHPDN